MLDLFETNGSSPPEQNEAYQHGYASGRADAWIGRLSEYAWYGELLDPIGSYSWWFSRGYRVGRTTR